jgi:hypothetical protein
MAGINSALEALAKRYFVQEANGIRRVVPRLVSPQIVPGADVADLAGIRALLADPATNQPARASQTITPNVR